MIEQRGDRLIIRGTFPAKPNSDRDDWHRQRIFLGVNATSVGINFAESEARKISALLDQNIFNWHCYIDEPENIIKQLTFDQLLQKFKEHKLAQGILQATWQDYADAFEILHEDFDIDKAIAAICKITANTRKRSRFCYSISSFFKFSGIAIDLKPYKGNYSPATVKRREIPTDALIQDSFINVKGKAWSTAYGILSTYGIRPHELVKLEFEDMPILIVRGTKSLSSDRRVYPIYPEWVEFFDLKNPNLPRTKNTGPQCCRQFQRHKIPFTPYDLRHAWAIRSMEFGLPLELAAQQMGHTMAVHSQTYHRWISDRHHKRAFDSIMANPDRITPPVSSNKLLLIDAGL